MLITNYSQYQPNVCCGSTGQGKRQRWNKNRGSGHSKLGLSLLCIFVLALFAAALTGCAAPSGQSGDNRHDKPIVLGDASWDSIQVHNRIIGYIIENGYGYKVDYLFGETLPLLQGLTSGDIDIYMELWTDNIMDAWQKALAEGNVVDLGPNFPDAPQGWYVPTYLIKGDPARGIEAVAPDLQSVFDLSPYKDLFEDAEAPSKGRFYNSPPGWVCTAINEEKFAVYGLDETYNLFGTGSDTALAASMVGAYEKGEPWFGYYWEPTWIMGKLDMTLLEEPLYDQEIWDSNRGCAYPAVKVHKAINSELQKGAPELAELVKNYATTLQQNNEVLAYMIENDDDMEKAALYFLQNHAAAWKTWLPEDIAVKVENSLSEAQ